MLPVEILEDIFAYLSRDDLEHCQIICLKWSKVIKTSNRLTQLRIVSLDYFYHHYGNFFHYFDGNFYHYFEHGYRIPEFGGPFYVELKSSTGKTIRIEYNDEDRPCTLLKTVIIDELGEHSMIKYIRGYRYLAYPVFKNVIIDELVEHSTVFEGLSLNISYWAGLRIIVKRVFLEIKTNSYINDEKIELLESLHDSLTEYIDADEITLEIFYLPEYEEYDEDEVLFNKESWKYFDFEKKTEFNLHYHSLISSSDFSDDTFKEFISGKYMKRSKLNELEIYFDEIEEHVITPLIVEAFRDTDEPHKFFKSIKTSSINYFDKIDGKFGFVRDDRDPQKYRLSHPKLKWALEATQLPDELLKFQLIEL